MKREDGFYWVKFQGDWVVGEWVDDDWCHYWYICGSEEYYPDGEFDEIGEQIKKPDV